MKHDCRTCKHYKERGVYFCDWMMFDCMNELTTYLECRAKNFLYWEELKLSKIDKLKQRIEEHKEIIRNLENQVIVAESNEKIDLYINTLGRLIKDIQNANIKILEFKIGEYDLNIKYERMR